MVKTVRKKSDGKVFVTDGPYMETKEHIGGFWILEAADMEAAHLRSCSLRISG